MKGKILLLASVFCSAFAWSQNANVQIVHNCPTPAADSVDIYLFDGTNWNTTAAVSNLKFRQATPYVSLPAISGLRVAVAPRDASPSIADTLASFAVPALTANADYVAFAAGLVGDVSRPFNIYFSGGAQAAASGSVTDLLVFHGGVDAPSVSVFVAPNGAAPAIPALDYGSFTASYISFAPQPTLLALTPSADLNSLVAGFSVDLTPLSGAAAVVFASGYLNAGSGAAFGLFAALPSGAVVQLAATPVYRLQVAHNCPDPLAAVVDVYVDAGAGPSELLDSLAFRSGSPVLLLPVAPLDILIAPYNAGAGAAVATIPFSPVANTNYTAVANGLIDFSGTKFDQAESVNSNQAFNLKVVNDARVRAGSASDVSVYVYHQAPDAPAVDINLNTGGTVTTAFANVPYMAAGEAELPAAAPVQVEVAPAGQTTPVAAYTAPVNLFAGQAISVFASGFLTPGDENVSNLPAFGLWALTAAGGPMIPLPAVALSLEQDAAQNPVSLYPNPSQGFITLSGVENATSYSIISADGKTWMSGLLQPGANTLDVSVLPAGTYYVKSAASGKVLVNSFVRYE